MGYRMLDARDKLIGSGEKVGRGRKTRGAYVALREEGQRESSLGNRRWSL